MNGQDKDSMYSSSGRYRAPTYPSRRIRGILKDVDQAYTDKKPSKLQQGVSIGSGLMAAFTGADTIKAGYDARSSTYDVVDKYLKGLTPEMRKKFKVPTREQAVHQGRDDVSYGDFKFPLSKLASSQMAKDVPPELLKLLDMMPDPIPVPEDE